MSITDVNRITDANRQMGQRIEDVPQAPLKPLMKYEVIFETPEGKKKIVICDKIDVGKDYIRFIDNELTEDVAIFPRDKIWNVKRIE